METRKKERIHIYQKRNICFIGIDMHKDIHCAAIIDCWMQKLSEITFENRPSKFPAFVEDVRKICGTKEFVFGLEDTRGFGRNLSAYLVGRKFDVKHVNPAYTSAVRLSNPIVYKDDGYDAYCVARVLRDMVDSLPDAKHEDIFWTIRQLVKRRDLLVKNNVMNKNTLHNQLMYSYPSYRKFFAEIDGKSALCFWENYPSPEHIQNTTPEKVYDALGNCTKYTYDKNNRLVSTEDAEGHKTLQTYDNAGNIAAKTDGKGNTTAYEYDEFNRLKSVTNAKGKKTSYTYYADESIHTKKDRNGNMAELRKNQKTPRAMYLSKLLHAGY